MNRPKAEIATLTLSCQGMSYSFYKQYGAKVQEEYEVWPAAIFPRLISLDSYKKSREGIFLPNDF